MKLSAKFEIKPRGHLLFITKKDTDTSMSFAMTHDDFHIDLTFILDKRGGVRAQTESCTTYASNDIKITVTREEAEALPPIEDKDYWRYFGDRAYAYTEIAIYALNCFIRFFKYKLGNPLLNDITQFEYSDLDNPRWEDESGAQLDPKFHTTSGSHSGGVHFYGSFDIKSYNPDVHAQGLQEALKKIYTPKLHEEILADARTAIIQENYRRAVLEMAIACEIYVKQFFFKTNEISSAVFDYLEEKRKIDVNVIELINSISKHAFGESFKDTHGDDYKNIEYLFRARNKIAHTGQCFYKNDHGVKETIDNETLLKEWWSSIKAIFAWLETKTK